jgi:uncharacterized protein
MKYRKFGGMDWEVSALGFGAMRFPVLNDNQSEINEPEAERMICEAIDSGVNYIDTAYIYHNGKSEPFLGKILKNGYREKVKLATKLPPWSIKSADDFDKILDKQLKSLQTEWVEFYLLHALDDVQWPKLKELGVLEWAERVKKEGKIQHLGFSYHDHVDLFKEIIDEYDGWEFCQIQYNYMDIEFQAGREGLDYAADKGLGVIIMEPLRGGQLVNDLPDSIKEIWSTSPIQRSAADWALQWVWNHPGVSTILSGMSTMDQVRENILSADMAEAGSMGEEDLNLVEKVRHEFIKTTPIPCTGCKYCLPCQADVAILTIFQRYNDGFRYQNMERVRKFYNTFISGQQADRCEECYECEEHCPQEIPIVEWLKKCHETLKSE